jgi:hypothetical protein
LGIGEHWLRQYYNIILFFEASAFLLVFAWRDW